MASGRGFVTAATIDAEHVATIARMAQDALDRVDLAIQMDRAKVCEYGHPGCSDSDRGNCRRHLSSLVLALGNSSRQAS